MRPLDSCDYNRIFLIAGHREVLLSEDSYNVLVVEDHPDVAEMMMVMLDMLGHKGTTAQSIAQAVDILSREEFDLLLVDYRLPDGIGCELLGRLPPEKAIPAVLLTAFDEFSLAPSTTEGFVKLLRKPVELEELRSVVSSICRS